MGLFDIAQELLGDGQAANAGPGSLVNTVVQVLNGQSGGLAGVVQSLQQGGLSDVVGSWIGTGQNAPVSGDQLQNILGSGVLQDLAAKLGVSPGVAGSHLSQLLPGIVDHLTPNGEVPQGGLSDAGMDLVKGFLARKFGA